MGWRWIFFINIPIVLLGYSFSRKSVNESITKQVNRALDWMGMLLLALTMGGIVMGLTQSQTAGWFDLYNVNISRDWHRSKCGSC